MCAELLENDAMIMCLLDKSRFDLSCCCGFLLAQEEAVFWGAGIMLQQKLQRELGASYQVVTGFESRPVE